MLDGFVSLEQYLRSSNAAGDAAIDNDMPCRNERDEECELDDEPSRADACVVRHALRAQAAIADAMEVVRGDLLRDLACDILGRELQLAPCDIAGIVTQALARCRAEFPMAVRVHPDDLPALQNCAVAVIADANLRRGDALLDVRKGTIDMTLGARLAEVLAVYSGT